MNNNQCLGHGVWYRYANCPICYRVSKLLCKMPGEEVYQAKYEEEYRALFRISSLGAPLELKY